MKGTIWNSRAAARQPPGGDAARLSKLHVRFIGAVTGGRYSRYMRALLPIATVCLLLLPLWTEAATPQSAPATAASTAPAAPPAAAPAGTPAATAADNDAAAKHDKRTACRKNAKAKKLVGDQKTTFIKDCVAAS
jgi:psiF repeat